MLYSSDQIFQKLNNQGSPCRFRNEYLNFLGHSDLLKCVSPLNDTLNGLYVPSSSGFYSHGKNDILIFKENPILLHSYITNLSDFFENNENLEIIGFGFDKSFFRISTLRSHKDYKKNIFFRNNLEILFQELLRSYNEPNRTFSDFLYQRE
jgi:hypothetical protein